MIVSQVSELHEVSKYEPNILWTFSYIIKIYYARE